MEEILAQLNPAHRGAVEAPIAPSSVGLSNWPLACNHPQDISPSLANGTIQGPVADAKHERYSACKPGDNSPQIRTRELACWE